MLRATRRVLRSGGRLSLLVIAVAPDLTSSERERARDHGPEYADAGDGYPALFRRAGFSDIEVTDLTTEFRVTYHGWIEAWEAESAGIAALIGREELEERQARRRETLAAIDDGLLVRYLVTGATA